MKNQIRAQLRVEEDVVAFWLRQDAAGVILVPPDETKWTIHPEDAPQAATLKLSRQESQILIDDLWRAGLRPSQTWEEYGGAEARKAHLEDMRQIAFRFIDTLTPNGARRDSATVAGGTRS